MDGTPNNIAGKAFYNRWQNQIAFNPRKCQPDIKVP
jgi:hypothetical protein